MKTLTAANSVLLLSVEDLFDTPVQLQGFAADDIYDIEGIQSTETSMGVDGLLSGGWIPAPIVQNISLQADSDSVDIFEDWYSASQAAREIYIANGSIFLPSVGKGYTMTRGFLTNFSPAPSGKKTLQSRKFTITWQSISAAAIAV